MAQNSNYRVDLSNQRFFTLTMAIFFAFVASPWLTILFKLKKIRMLAKSILQFYNGHFIGEDDELTQCKCPINGNGDI
jgi:hypothetical protein